MFTALDAPPSALDPGETTFITKLREHGWCITNVFADKEGPGFAYTTGFWVSVGAPEVIVFSLEANIAHTILWEIYRGLKSGRQLLVGQRVAEVFLTGDAMFLPVGDSQYPNYLGWSRWFYGGDQFPCVQLVWPDTNETFPWEPGYEQRFTKSQPDLTGGDWLGHSGLAGSTSDDAP